MKDIKLLRSKKNIMHQKVKNILSFCYIFYQNHVIHRCHKDRKKAQYLRSYLGKLTRRKPRLRKE